jgi:hypothetical protein
MNRKEAPMADLTPLHIFAFTEEAMSLYTNDGKEDFQVVYNRTYSQEPPAKEVKIIQVSCEGKNIPKTDGIGGEIRDFLLKF